MKNKVLRILGAASLVLFMSSLMTSCSVEDGVDGLNGIDGIDGANGQDGVDGQDGADGADAIGLEEFAKYGSIELRVQGMRPDSVAFDYETELEFISPALDNNNFRDDDPDHEFYFLRLLNAPNVDEINGAAISLDVIDAGLASQSFSFEIQFSDFAIFSDDLTYISLDDSYYGAINTNNRVSNNYGVATTFTISEYSFDDTTNNLKFSFVMEIDGNNNETGNHLRVDGAVDIMVFENVNPSY
ncbi:MAG: hypothetical protein ABJN95_06785 [Maribacter sp.]|uniref:hypothetical protein n=1 Tax=Maribacter sp. TaxID=1897614 RepID=UPI003299A47D